MQIQDLIGRLSADTPRARLEALEALKQAIDRGELTRTPVSEDVNNHIHTTYSFSPYSPAKAVWMACRAGLKTAGIMDHDSVGGAREFIEAGRIMGLMTTVGVECRVKMTGTPIADKRINNPDQKGVAYMALHGIPHGQIDKVRAFFTPYTAARILRGREMAERINALMAGYGLALDFDRDILPLSMAHDSGSVTERHILFALALKMTEKFGKGGRLVTFLRDGMRLPLSEKLEGFLLDAGNAFYEYDLLGVLKSDLIEKIYVDADAECPDVRQVIRLANEIGAIAAYAYLGDVGDSVTGDKKTQAFEDSYLDTLFETIRALGFHAVTYMPSRNTPQQLERIRALCVRHGFFQISGEDINTPRQSFICVAQRGPEFAPLRDAALALIGHELAATENADMAMFSPAAVAKTPDLDERVQVYKALAARNPRR